MNSFCNSLSTTSCNPKSPSCNNDKPKYIYQLPYTVRKSLCDLMDADGSWKQLGGICMNLNDTELTLISHAFYRGASPTNDLLVRWEQSNPSIHQLFKYLHLIRNKRAMLILKSFVGHELSSLCDNEECDDILGAIGYDFEIKEGNRKQKNISHWNNLGTENPPHQPEKYRDKGISCVPSIDSTSIQSTIDEELEVPYKELLLSTDDFSENRIIGSGGFGLVYKGNWKGTQVAIKRLKGCENMSQAITELKVLNRYRIDNILPLYGISLDGPEACLVYQYMPNGSLEDRLLCKCNTPPLTWLQRASIGEGIARALNYLHTLKGKPLVHGDVKSANVLLDAQFECKLGDFGLSRQIMGSSDGMYTHITVTSVHGTSVYLPPEYLRSKVLSSAVDVYSYGIVMIEMATGRRAFNGKRLLIDLVREELGSNGRCKENILKLKDPKLNDSNEEESWFYSLIKLGLDCAQTKKNKRPNMIQILDYYQQCKMRFQKKANEEDGEKKIPSSVNEKLQMEIKPWCDILQKTSNERLITSTISPTVGSSVHQNYSTNRSPINFDSHSDLQKCLIKDNLVIDESKEIIPLITELGLNDANKRTDLS